MVNFMKLLLKMDFNSILQKSCKAVVRFASKFLVRSVLSIKKFFPFLVAVAVLVTVTALPCFAVTPTSQTYRFWYFSRVENSGFTVSNSTHLNESNILHLSSSSSSSISMGFWKRVPANLVAGVPYSVTVRYHNLSGHNVPIVIMFTDNDNASDISDFTYLHNLNGSVSVGNSWTTENFSVVYNGENYLYFWVTSSGLTDLFMFDISFNYVNVNEGVENRLDETNDTLNNIDDTLNGEGESFTIPDFPDISFENTYNDDFQDAFDSIKDNFSLIEQDPKIIRALTGFKYLFEGFFDGFLSFEVFHPWFYHLVWFFIGITLFGFIINLIGTGVSRYKGGKHK